MILFVVLGIFILIISFIIAFASLIREQRENFNTEESIEPSSLRKEPGLLEKQPESDNSASMQSVYSVQSDVADLPSTEVAAGEAAQEDPLSPAAIEPYPWEQEKTRDMSGPDPDKVTAKTSPQKLSGVIPRKDIVGRSGN